MATPPKTQPGPQDNTTVRSTPRGIGALRSAWPIALGAGAGMGVGYAGGKLLGLAVDRFSKEHYGTPIPVAKLIIPGGLLGIAAGAAYAKAQKTTREAIADANDQYDRRPTGG